MAKKIKNQDQLESRKTIFITGLVAWEIKNEPVAAATVQFLTQGKDEKTIARTKTDKTGYYNLSIPILDGSVCCLAGSLLVQDRNGITLHHSSSFEVCVSRKEIIVNILIPVTKKDDRQHGKEQNRQTITLGNIALDAIELERLKPNGLFEIAKSFVKMNKDEKSLKRIEALSPQLLMNDKKARTPVTLCGTSILQAIYEIIHFKDWPREVRLEVEDILSMHAFGFGFATHDCGNFIVNYDTSGPAAVNSSNAAEDVVDPGSSPSVVLATLPAGGDPTYIKRVCFWLERALASYVTPPFSLLNPASGGKIQVYINTAPYGSATPGAFYLNNNLAPDLMCAVAVHELFHMVQYQYGTSGAWGYSMTEGGAVFAEDSAADSMNRYLDEAGTNFNGTGVLDDPTISLETAGYKCSLFWRYIAEQQSPRITPGDEPKIGVETYRTLIEKCALAGGTYSTDNIKQAIRELPWYQDFYEFSYLDSGGLDRLSSETIFGNYVLACYLKRLGTNLPDRRFDFMEDDDNIYIDDVIHVSIPTSPLQTQLAQVHLAGTGTVNTSGTVSFLGTVNKFASKYFEVIVNPAVTNIQITFSGTGGLTSSLFQIAQIDQDGQVRDINRTDKASYSKRITNLRGTKKLSKLLLVVSGANTPGSFTVNAASASASSDVMITKWHTIMKNEYEIDSRNWAWTWVSPDIWVDNDGNGIADSEVYFNFNNKLTIRLHNKGNQDASGIQVDFYYQDASGGLSDAGWLPVRNLSGTIQVLTGLTLAQGISNTFEVDWSPAPSGMSHHFCVRAIVTVPGDPNTDNKRAQSNFGNVVTAFGHFKDISFIRRNIYEKETKISIYVVPRLGRDFTLAISDIKENQTRLMFPGEVMKDTIRILHIPAQKNRNNAKLEHTHQKPSRYAIKPDPLAYYSTPKEALPPGVDPKSLITIVHEANGFPLGGMTFQIKLDEEIKVKSNKSIKKSK